MPPAPPPPDAPRVLRSLVRARAVLLGLAVVVPAGCFGLFERQARRLDVLAERGVVAQATVTGVRDAGGGLTTAYAYEVDGARHTWSVARAEAPFEVGASFPVLVSPADPSLSLPGVDRAKAAARAAESRGFAHKLVGGIFAFFAANALVSHVRLARVRATGRTELDDPVAYRRRLAMTGAILAPMILGVTLWHARDAAAKGESIVPVVLATALALGVLAGTGAYVLREGRAHANARAARLLRWAVPAAIAIAVLRLVAWAITGAR